jgi:CubicO group peptidase (beta-lactamase class C family)
MFRTTQLLLFVLLLSVAASAQPGPAGDWTGEIAVPGQPLRIEVSLEHTNGAWSGTIAIPVQNLSDFALSGVEVDGQRVSFRMEGIPGTPTFDGALAEDGTRIEGTFSQGGADLGFFLERADAAREAAAAATRDALDGFEEFVRAAMDSLAVPVAAVAIVRDDEVVFMEGFGYRDVDRSLPVTSQTLFAIGSSTKAFTAATLGALVDEGRLEWNDPVIDHLPAFRLADPVATAGMTAVDLLTHRSGLPRHDLLWYATDFDRHELFNRLRHLEPSEPFRSEWQYQNLMYLVAGILTEELTGQTWESAVRERLLAPLGMNSAGFSVVDMQQQPDFARPYGGGRDTIEVMDFKPLDAIGPAGSINASVQEMARWARLQLGDGTLDGTRLLEAGTLRAMHRPVIVVAGQTGLEESPYLMYSLGWFVEPYHGHRMIHHGGNIDGFSALVGFMPDENVGVVVLTNKNASGLPRAVMMTAFDRLLGIEGRDWIQQAAPPVPMTAEQPEPMRVEGTTPSRALADFAGRYEHPGYGLIDVAETGSGLRFDYYAIGGELEHVHYDTFEFTPDQLPIAVRMTFQANAQGRINRLEVPLELTSDPIAFHRAPEERHSDPEYLADFVGTYRGSGLTFTISPRGRDALAVTVAGQGTWTLIPAGDDAFDIAGLSGFHLRFERSNGAVSRLVGTQPGATFTADREGQSE